MSLAELLSGRVGHAARLPDRLEELRGPARGVVVLPRHLSWPGMREFDVTDDSTRRSMYGIVLTQGQRNDMMRFLNPALLRADWPQIRARSTPGCGAAASGASRWPGLPRRPGLTRSRSAAGPGRGASPGGGFPGRPARLRESTGCRRWWR